jgi:hypothetical protein
MRATCPPQLIFPEWHSVKGTNFELSSVFSSRSGMYFSYLFFSKGAVSCQQRNIAFQRSCLQEMLRSRGTFNGWKRAINKIYRQKKKRNETMMKHTTCRRASRHPGGDELISIYTELVMCKTKVRALHRVRKVWIKIRNFRLCWPSRDILNIYHAHFSLLRLLSRSNVCFSNFLALFMERDWWPPLKAEERTRRNLPQYHFVHHKSHMTRPGLELGPPLWKAAK